MALEWVCDCRSKVLHIVSWLKILAYFIHIWRCFGQNRETCCSHDA